MEPQWERAARWAANEKGYDDRRWPWGNDEKGAVLHANVGGSLGTVASVGLYESTGPALFDMAGNAWEWMDNAFSVAHDGRFDRAPRNHQWRHAVKWQDSELRSLRGCSWVIPPEHASCSDGGRYPPGDWNYDLGFRVVLSLARNET